MTLTVNSVSQTFTWPSPIIKIYQNPSLRFPLDVPITNPDYSGSITYSSSDAIIASVDPVTGEVTINSVGSGSVIITAHLASDGNYDSTTVTTTLFIGKANQSITVGPIPITQPLKDFSVLQISATVSPSGAPVYISLAPGSAATLSGTVGNYELVSLSLIHI